jgi:hypothetical protein
LRASHTVFSRLLDPEAASARSELIEAKDVSRPTEYLADQLANPPLETIARLCLNLEIPEQTTMSIFDNYDRFLCKWMTLASGRIWRKRGVMTNSVIHPPGRRSVK